MSRFFKVLLLLFFALFLCSGVAMAAAMNMNRPLTLGPSSVPEPTLQEIFDSNISNGSIDAFNDQSNVALWTPDEGVVDSYFVTRFAGDSGVLGIYSATTGAEYDFSFSPTPTSSISFFITDAGGLFIGGSLADAAFGDEFGFYWKDNSVTNQSYTEDSKNTSGGFGPDNNIMALTYLVPDEFRVLTKVGGGTTVTARSNNDWLLAFEDRITGDGDFNDAIYFVEDLKPIPEPATMLLVGSGLIGLAGLGRRKFFKKS